MWSQPPASYSCTATRSSATSSASRIIVVGIRGAGLRHGLHWIFDGSVSVQLDGTEVWVTG